MIKKISHLKIRTQFLLLLLISLLLSFLLYEALWQNRDYVFAALRKVTNLPVAPTEKFFNDVFDTALNYDIPDSMDDVEQVKAIEPYFDIADPYTSMYIYGTDDGLYRAGKYADFFGLDQENSLHPVFSLHNLLLPDSGMHEYQYTVEFNNGYALVIINGYHQLLFLLPWLLISMGAALLLFFGILLFFINRKMKCVVRLEKDVLRMAGGDLETPVPTLGYDELGSLSRELDYLRQTLAEAIRQEQESRTANQDLITAMSHDLRTPLTVLNGYLEVLHLGRNPALHDEYLNRCLKKTAELRELTDRMFEYALVYDDRNSAELTEIPADFLLQCINDNAEYLRLTGFQVNIAENLRSYFTANSGTSDSSSHTVQISAAVLSLPTGSAPQCTILADPTMLKRVFSNLFSNIIKYGDKKEAVSVSVEASEALQNPCVLVTLTNTVKKDASKTMWIRSIRQSRLTNTVKKDASKTESNRIGLKSVRKMLALMGGEFDCTESESSFCAAIILKTVASKHL